VEQGFLSRFQTIAVGPLTRDVSHNKRRGYFMNKSISLSILLLVCVLPASPFPDSLIVIPPHPTLSDSIKIKVITPSQCCCLDDGAIFNYDSTMVSTEGDSAIFIYKNYKYLPGSTCIDTICAVCGINYLNYKLPPMTAGKYTIYKIGLFTMFQCTGSSPAVCTTKVVYTVDTIKEGNLIVSTTAIIYKSLPFQIFKSDNKYYIYDLRGRLISTSAINIHKNIPGIYFLKTGNNITKRYYLK
jgi:hypothetical protein